MTDRSAFDEFVHARSGALARTAYLLTGHHHTAEDLLQHALLQTARHREGISTSLEAYARRVMYHPTGRFSATSPGSSASVWLAP